MSEAEWTKGHELAALERLFEIALERLRERGAVEFFTARGLALSGTATATQFARALASVARMTPEQIHAEVAHVHRVVAERCAP